MMRSRHLLATTFLAVLAGVGLLVMRDAGPAAPVSGNGVPAPQQPAAGIPEAGSLRGFRTPELFRQHYAKHGREFGNITPEEYLRQAQALRDAAPAANVLEIRRKDGVVTRFDRDSGSFIALDGDGTIRTFFRPADGERYFRRQAASGH